MLHLHGIVSWFEKVGHIVEVIFSQASIVDNSIDKFNGNCNAKYLARICGINIDLREKVSQSLKKELLSMIIRGIIHWG